MFETVPMIRWEAVVLDRDLRKVLHELGALGVVQFIPVAPGPDTAPQAALDAREARGECRRVRSLVAELRRVLPTPAVPRHLSRQPGTSALDRCPSLPSAWLDVPATLADLERKTRHWQQRRENLQHQLADEHSRAERVADYSGSELPLLELAGLRRLVRYSGSVPEAAWDRLDPAARAHGFLTRLGRRHGRVYLLALTTSARRPELEEALRRAGFRQEPLPRMDAETPEAALARSSEELRCLEGQLCQVDAEGTQLAREAGSIVEQAEALTEDEERILRAAEGFPRTKTAVLLTGWAPAADATRAVEGVRRATDGRCVLTISPGTDTPAAPVPVVMCPPGWLRPFARLVEPYGLPRYGEIDPTLFVAFGYLVMFGVMFGDVGHGALLALAGVALRAWLSTAPGRDLGRILGWAGVASAGFGFLYGSCFGLPSFRAHALWRDPLEVDPMLLVSCALALGTGSLALGMGLNLVNRWRARDWGGFWCDHFGVAGAVFYASGILWVLGQGGRPAYGVPAWAGWLGLGLPWVAWCLRVPLERMLSRSQNGAASEVSLGGAWAESVVGAFEASLLFLANTVSFVRLAAYALSHAAILAATFAMAEQVRSVPRLGSVLALILIVAGNLTAIVIEGLVAAVQALRLQYYEFFGKFFSGEGMPFIPFRLSVSLPGPDPPRASNDLPVWASRGVEVRDSFGNLAANERQSS